LKAFYWDLWQDLAHLRLEYQRATSVVLLIGKWWKFACFPFCLVTKPLHLRNTRPWRTEVDLVQEQFE